MRILPVVAAALVFALACKGRQAFPEHGPFEADPKTAADVTDDDVAVFEGVNAAYAESGEVVGLGAPPAGVRRLSAAEVARLSSEQGLEMLASTQRCGAVPLTGWRDFADGRSVEGLELPVAAANEFDKRNAHRVALDRFQPGYLKVIRTNEIGHETVSVRLPADRKRAIELPGNRKSGRTVAFTLPGYSADRALAVIEITSYAPAPYGFGSDFVVLRRTHGGWRALARHIGCVT